MIKAGTKRIKEALKKCELFSCLKDDDLNDIAENFCKQRSLKKGSIVNCDDVNNSIVVLVEGKAQLRNKYALITQLDISQPFFAEGAYGKTDSGCFAVAVTKCDMVFVAKNGIDMLISKSPKFAKCCISLLSSQINFLNKKINIYTAKTSEERVKEYLVCALKDKKQKSDLKITDIADELNIGRASLYRAMEKLENDNIIVRDGKKINIIKF